VTTDPCQSEDQQDRVIVGIDPGLRGPSICVMLVSPDGKPKEILFPSREKIPPAIVCEWAKDVISRHKPITSSVPAATIPTSKPCACPEDKCVAEMSGMPLEEMTIFYCVKQEGGGG
jgi:hypothetical protein